MHEIFDRFSGHRRAWPIDTLGVPATDLDNSFKRDVLAGLRRPRKEVPCKYFYDRRGLDLSEAIATTPEYYPARVELALLKACAGTIAELVGEGATLIELGDCDMQKARLLLGALSHPLVYMPVDHSIQRLWSAAMQLQLDYPYLAVRPLSADYATLGELPEGRPAASEQVTFLFLGSAISSYDPISAVQLLRRISGLTTRNLMVIGLALRQDERVMSAAYNDAAGFTAELNLNLLLRINRELDGDFDLGAFEHLAFWNDKINRVEMYLRSLKRQTVHVAGEEVSFERHETIHTDSSYKYTVGQVHRLVQRAGYVPVKAWTDPERRFGLHVLAKAGELFS